MNYCVVPSWDLDDDSAPPKLPPHAPSNSSNSNVSSFDYEVTELTWENGQIAMHGLGPPRGGKKSAAPPPWDKPRAAAGTLESIVSQATTCHAHDGGGHNELQVPWFDHNHSAAAAANLVAAASHGVPITKDALVPCQINHDYNNNNIREKSVPCMVGSCSGAAAVAGIKRRGMCGCRTNACVSESATCGGGGRDSRQVTVDGFTSTSLWSPENTSSGGGEYTKTSADELDHSVCHSRSQMENGDHEGKRKLGVGKSSICTKRSRAAAIHNQSERKRRDRINQRMKTLQKLVPNCSKTDKASMLDEVIEYLRQLQAQVHMMSRLSMPSMVLPMPLALQQQQLQMSMMAPAMGMGVMDINSIGRAAAAAMPPPPAAAFVPMPSWDAPIDRPMIVPSDVLSALMNNCQSQQPITMDAYSRLAALYQHFQQPPDSGSKN